MQQISKYTFTRENTSSFSFSMLSRLAYYTQKIYPITAGLWSNGLTGGGGGGDGGSNQGI